MFSKILVIIIIILTICLVAFLIFQNNKLRQRIIKSKTYLKNLESKLHANIIDLDNLVLTLTSIHEFGLTATGVVSKQELANIVVETVANLFRTEQASLMLLNTDNELYIIASRGLSKKVIEDTKMKIGEGIAGRVVSTGKYVFVENIETDVRFLRPNMKEKYSSKSFISVPLRVQNKIIGVLNVNSPKEKKQFTDRDVQLLTIFSDQIAITLHNIELFNDLQSFYSEMIQTLARTLDAKDSYTHDHADRARKYSKLIAQEMNLPPSIVRHIEYAALMHDIGKIGIPNEILQKPGKLTEEERNIIKQHPVIGHKIILPVKYLSQIAPMVLYHQEMYDGSGYPEGLSGEEIPLGARIVSVIDAFDAMTSDRPYRKALPIKVAIDELKKGAGKQFDPRIVKAFIEILNKEHLIK